MWKLKRRRTNVQTCCVPWKSRMEVKEVHAPWYDMYASMNKQLSIQVGWPHGRSSVLHLWARKGKGRTCRKFKIEIQDSQERNMNDSDTKPARMCASRYSCAIPLQYTCTRVERNMATNSTPYVTIYAFYAFGCVWGMQKHVHFYKRSSCGARSNSIKFSYVSDTRFLHLDLSLSVQCAKRSQSK